MDRISQLPDELLLKILSFLPVGCIVDTMGLSKRWEFLWLMVPELEFDYNYKAVSYRKFSRLVERCLLLHEAPTLNALKIKPGEFCTSGDIQVWTKAAQKRDVRELIIEIKTSTSCQSFPLELPRSLYRCFRKLVTLGLRNAVLVDDVASLVSFPSLKKLSLKSMIYPSDVFVDKLLSSCPVLEDLVVEQCPGDNVPIFSVRLRHLKSLVLSTSGHRSEGEAHGFVIEAPSLEYLDIVDDTNGFCVIGNDMSKIVNASVFLTRPHTEQIVGSITSAKRLFLCLRTSENVYLVGSVFHRLEHLKICTCETGWLNLLMRVLNDSPKLRSLKLQKCHDVENPRPCWTDPSSVPERMLSSLETLEWERYKGTEEEKEVVSFILRSAKCLENVTIKADPTTHKKIKLIKELSFLPRRSPACRIKFN